MDLVNTCKPCTDYNSHSAYFEIRRISSICYLLMKKATAQVMHSFVLSCWDYCNSLITSDQMYSLKNKSKSCSHSCVHRNHFSKSFTSSQSKNAYFSRQPPLLSVSLPPYLSSGLSVYTPSHTLHSSSDEKKQLSFQCKMKT